MTSSSSLRVATLLALCLLVNPANAQNILVGAGTITCAEVRSSPEHRRVARTWLSGFLYGLDLASNKDEKDPVEKSALRGRTAEEIDALLTSICLKTPSARLTTAGVDIYIALRAAR